MQVKRKGTKKSVKIVLIVVATLIFLLATPTILLNINKIQNAVVQKITQILSKELETTVSIGHVDMHYFSHLRFEKVYMADQNGDTLLAAECLSGHFLPWRLFKKELNFPSIELQNPCFHITKNADGTSNADFLKKLKSDKKSELDMALQFGSVRITDGHVQFQNAAAHAPKPNVKFDMRDIEVSELNLLVNLLHERDSTFEVELKEFSFVEKSGFRVENVQAQVSFTDSLFMVPSLCVNLPNSQLCIDSLSLSYSDLERISLHPYAVHLRAFVPESHLYFPDLDAFGARFGYLRHYVNFSGHLHGTLNSLHLNSLRVSYDSGILFDGDFHLTGLPDFDELYAYAKLNEISFTSVAVQDLVANLAHRPVILPAEVQSLGKCCYKGVICGFTNDLVLQGNLVTNAGVVNTNVSLKLRDGFKNIDIGGDIKSAKLQLGMITPQNLRLGDLTFDINTKFHRHQGEPLSMEATLVVDSIDFRDYKYHNIMVDGNYSDKEFIGAINVSDPNVDFRFDGNVDFTCEGYVFDFDSRIDSFKPYNLHLVETNPNLMISASLHSDFEGPNIDKFVGKVEVDSLFLRNDSTFFLPKLTIASQVDQTHQITIKSDLITANIDGDYEFSSLRQSAVNTLKSYFPLLKYETKELQRNNNLKFNISVGKTEKLVKALSFGWYNPKPMTITGEYDDLKNSFGLDVEVPKVCNNKKKAFNNVALHVDNAYDRINAAVQLSKIMRKHNDTISVRVDLSGRNDSICTHLAFENTRPEMLHAGELLLNAQLYQKDEKLNIKAQVLPTQCMLQNALFDIGATDLATDLEKLSIKNWSIKSENQQLYIDGVASKSIDDEIYIDIQNLSLDFISSLLPPSSPLSFSGDLTGEATIKQAFAMPIIQAKVQGKSFIFNDAYLGRVDAETHFVNDEKCIAFSGIVASDLSNRAADIKGGYYITQDSLDLIGKADHLDIRFIEPFLGNVLQNVRGKASGDVHVYGYTRKKQIAVTVDALAEEAQADIGYLGTTYFFTDSIRLTPTEILLSDIDLYDEEGNHALLNGKMQHEYFKNLTYRLNIDCKKLKVLNTTSRDNDTFYGKAYATGEAMIYGNTDQTNIRVDATTDKRTKLIIPLGASTATENSFITFVNHDEQVEFVAEEELLEVEDEGAEMNLNLSIHITPQAEIQLYVDPRTGDVLKATGDGDIRMSFNDRTNEFKMYGSYEIENGSYLFTFQDAIRKEFKVKEGGVVEWNGDATNPRVSIDGYYQLNASLLDVLDHSYLESSNRTTVLVQCLLNLSGNLSSPVIKFDLNLPNSDEELNRALHATVNTDEMMTREIIYLLVVGKFFTPETMKSNGTMFSQGDLLAVASSTVSAQLNNLASQMFEGWNFGVNFRSTDVGTGKSNEYEFNFLYTPNNRISINGNVGYRDDNLSASKFIGDFDFEYKLIQSGKLSAKAYTHTNDYNEFKTGQTTQGIGLVYRETFSDGKDLVDSWKNSIEESKKERAERRERRRAKREAKQAAKEAAKLEKSK